MFCKAHLYWKLGSCPIRPIKRQLQVIFPSGIPPEKNNELWSYSIHALFSPARVMSTEVDKKQVTDTSYSC